MGGRAGRFECWARRNVSGLVGATTMLLFGTLPAHAYTVSSPVGAGCHEAITSAALRQVRLELPTAVPMPATRNEQAMIDDVDYHPEADMTDLGAVSLMLGVRDNDVKGHNSADLAELALVHGDPNNQREHCLRSQDEQEPGGTQAAVDDCEAFILQRVGEALQGLDASGAPDTTKRTTLRVYLQLRHEVDVPLPTYYVRIGQAVHALEDAYTHNYRTPDSSEITVVLNWVRLVQGDWVEERDGPPHSAELDRCDDPDDLRLRRHELAVAAAASLLRVTLDPSQSEDRKMAAVHAILDANLGISPGCSFANGWCDAPERAYPTGFAHGCGMGATNAIDHGFAGLALVGLTLVGLALRGARRSKRLRSPWLVLLILTGCLLVGPERAQAATESPLPTPQAGAKPVKEPLAPNPSHMAWGGFVGAAGSFDHGAMAFSAALRLRLTTHLTVGLDAEWNPFIRYNGVAVRPGTFNAYGTGILRLPLAYEVFNLRTTVSFGMATMLMDLYGVPRGTTGLFAGIAPLGLEWKMSRACYLIVNPLGYDIPIPQLNGVPYSYSQYRVSIGLEFYP